MITPQTLVTQLMLTKLQSYKYRNEQTNKAASVNETTKYNTIRLSPGEVIVFFINVKCNEMQYVIRHANVYKKILMFELFKLLY